MAFWNDTTSSVTTRKRIWRVELHGDINGDFNFVAHLERVYIEGGIETGKDTLDPVSILYSQAVLDPVLEPLVTKIKNGCRALARELRKA